jgi:hypothetical protein
MVRGVEGFGCSTLLQTSLMDWAGIERRIKKA